MTDNSPANSQILAITVGETEGGTRLDSFLVSKLQHLTRAKIQRAINKGGAIIDGKVCKSSFKVGLGMTVRFQLPPVESEAPIPEEIPLEVLFEDEHMIGINKPAQMVVHPAKGHWKGTLTAALAFHFAELSSVGGPTRPGIVHRLDRDTSGVIVVAKTDQAHSALAKQFEQRTVEKQYFAIVSPPPNRDRDHIDKPIGIHPYQREKMAIRADHKSSRNASSFYEVQQRMGRFALIHVHPKTGRTHQIRVHMAAVGSSIVADKLYSGQSQLTLKDIDRNCGEDRIVLARQALHAQSIKIDHPLSGKRLEIVAPMAEDLAAAIETIREQAGK